ncbi:pimeloyl-CoA dehydrogenase small subunit [Sphingobium lactosutens]|uniref:acyl-CoA dehydrogenase family protein n=1 Tax=Sphingobium lactosutens TaxID=522773 RepID=UPI0015BD4360|nr:acyl-CoA dehydrogenase family protein [Sphingobium lactosutens]NWK98740.1 pimeloyl-CoA dehydrogenase small subunit [Sphingobium lactosutens]
MAILGESQEMLADLVGRYLSDNFDFETRRAALSGTGWPDRLWQAFAQELGILALPFAEEQGGLGLGALDAMVVMEALGRGLAAEPFLSSIIGFGALANRVDPVAREGLAPLVAQVIAGDARVALCLVDADGAPGCGNRRLTAEGDGWRLTGDASIVLAAAAATQIVLSAAMPDGAIGLALLAKDAPGLDWADRPLIDGSMAGALAADVSLSGTGLLTRDAGELVHAVHDAMLAALGAEITGIIAALIDITVDFASQRTQFGKPITKFQVIQHRLADMYVEGELARSMTLLAALKQDGDPIERAAAAAACKARTATAGRMVAQNAVQIHGGIGTTDELIVGHYFKRLLAIEALYGSAASHVKRYARHRTDLGMPVAVV